jgi:hypothetical protein
MADFDFDCLMERAQGQLETVEHLQLEAAALAFTPRAAQAPLSRPGQPA